MNTQHSLLRTISILRLFLVGLLLSTTLAVSVASRATVVKADSGEAPFGTVTQTLESAISLGPTHTCVITNGNLLCWGGNFNGQLGNGQSGNGNVLNQSTPTYVKDSAANSAQRLSNVIGVATADNHSCAIIAPLGKVKCWGYIGGNLLGRYATFQNAWQPYPDFVKSEFTNASTLASSGDLVGATSLAIGTYGSCALLDDGKVKCWGQSPGHAGDGVGYVTACASQPVDNTSCASTTGLPIDNIKQISKTGDTTCAIKNDGTMICWGSDQGMYGRAYAGGLTGMPSTYPKTAGADTFNARAVGNGQYSQCAIFQNAGTDVAAVGGTVKCWGQNNSGELGRNSTSADPGGVVAVVGITNAIAIAGHERSYCALLVDTRVKCWGGNSQSMFSVVEPSESSVLQPSFMLSNIGAVTQITGVAAVSVGTQHVCVIMQSNGAVKCSGQNANGQLGDGTVVAKSVGTNVNAGESCTSNCTGRSLSGAGGEFMPPVFLSAEVVTTGQKIVFTYEKALATTNLPLASSFDVKVGGVTRGVTSVAIVGSTVELTLASPISRALSVTITYTDPTTSNDTIAIQDLAGNDAATLTAQLVTNNSTTDLIAPVLVSGAVNTAGTQLTLTYDETLNATTAVPSRFTLTVAGRTKVISTATVTGSTVVLAVGSPVIQSPQSVTIAYSAITADNSVATNLAVQDTAGNDAASFTASAITVTNSSTVANLAPTLLTKETNREGTKIILTYDEPLGTTLPLADKFTVNIGSPGVARTVSTVLRGTETTTVELTLDGSPITEGQAITMAYVAPASSDATSNAAIQDLVGKDAAAITTTTVTNIVDAVAPTFVSARVDPTGGLAITYSEALATPAPATSSIVVTINGTPVTVSSVTVVGSSIVVVTSPVIGTGQTVTFTYTDPTTGNDANAIQDAAGNDASSSSSAYTVPSANNDSTVDKTSPTFVSGAVNTSGSLVVTYSEALTAPAPATTAIVVTIGGTAVTVTSVSLVGSTVVVVTSPVIQTGDVVTFTYTDPTTGNDVNALQDAAGNDVASSSSAYSVPGASNRSTVDVRPPTGVTIGVDTGGTQITIRFDEDLSPTGPSAGDFTVTVDGVKYTITKAEVVDGDLVLTVSPSVKSGQAVVVSYKDPTTGNDTNALQDAAGNDIPSFGDVKTQNSSTQVSATNQADSVLNTTLPVDTSTTTTTVPTTTKVVDGDAPTASLSTSETQSIAGKTGKAAFSDGSTFDVSKNGNLIPKLFTAYIGTVTGSVKVTYKAGKKTVSTTCSYGSYGSTKPKKVTKSVNGFFPKVFISPKKTCLMPKAAIAALNTQLVTISANLKFVRLWPTTGKAKNPESGAAVRPVKRAYSVKIGTAPK